ncbi:MAG: hypothetical protein WCA84_14605 [Ignavibacteriaceae bacterium]
MLVAKRRLKNIQSRTAAALKKSNRIVLKKVDTFSYSSNYCIKQPIAKIILIK